MPDKKEIERMFIFRKDLIAGGKPYDEFTPLIANRIYKITPLIYSDGALIDHLMSINRTYKIPEKNKNYFAEWDIFSLSLRKKVPPLPKLINYIKPRKLYQEVFFIGTHRNLNSSPSESNLPHKFRSDAFYERTKEFEKLCEKFEKEYDVSVYDKDGLLVYANIKDPYGKELSDLVKKEVNRLDIEFFDKFVNGTHIFLPKKYTSFPNDYDYTPKSPLK